jgi:hypothetical protein
MCTWYGAITTAKSLAYGSLGCRQPERQWEKKGDPRNFPEEGPNACNTRRGYGPRLLNNAWFLPPVTLKPGQVTITILRCTDSTITDPASVQTYLIFLTLSSRNLASSHYSPVAHVLRGYRPRLFENPLGSRFERDIHLSECPDRGGGDVLEARLRLLNPLSGFCGTHGP